jgi:hypothetical protein
MEALPNYRQSNVSMLALDMVCIKVLDVLVGESIKLVAYCMHNTVHWCMIYWGVYWTVLCRTLSQILYAQAG